MSIIAETSTALLVRIKTLCGNTLREVTEHPGQWDDGSVKRLVRNPPAVYVAWLGQLPSNRPNEVIARWGVFVVANVLNGKRQGQVGIYQIVEQLTAGIDGERIAPSGLFSLQSVQNLWSDTQSGMGVAVYAMYFNAQQPVPDVISEADIDDFITYHHQFNQSQTETVIDDKTQLTVILPKKGDPNDEN
ncbi:DUF1834 family protein [Testudinibacter sp. TR-2022]|uniref:DUF1834 family protein n=1 Tax=Testudinibacter sp. TR-2022 TaxID=2585029 RepID=UPI001119C803|nr:phage protein Gp37 [Testudinibacter sp. TR-2022]TNH04520.1 DUF1834 family protein [Pasteurellaceae bacterium Phil31]TNH11958.1 DUF1834 family protein [Testudinibacter sp. TR-2022]TNH12737.1 DUF1834 family protein [Testudinibacter sp. TR-2022]TNH13670.1 DUF1834 family protein [Testudinibacter sp. TR-2022]TNH17248.1 DUF1834 family protein [Testudinibacter sp. TR-2022]